MSLFGAWLRGALEERGMSQRELAKRTGFSTLTINRWCLGKYSPPIRDVEEIARVLGCHVEIVPDGECGGGAAE